MIPGETLLNGAATLCDECKSVPKVGVYKSAAGYYIGSYCQCGPYSRESHYYGSEVAAERELKYYVEALNGSEIVPPNSR